MYNLIGYKAVETRDITFILFHLNLDLENTTIVTLETFAYFFERKLCFDRY